MPPKIGVTAAGTVPTTGWTNPQLGAWFYISPPADGIQDLDFSADEPTGIVLRVFTPIAAALVIDRDPNDYWGKGKPLLGVRIHAHTNAIEAKFDGDKTIEADYLTLSARGGEVPWPSSGTRNLSGGDQRALAGKRIEPTASLSELLGKTLRVYRTGDLLSTDYLPDRANVELDPRNSRIVDVWFG